MKLIWNLVRKDYLHFRGRWAYWIVTLALKTLLGLGLLLGGFPSADPLRLGMYALTILVPTEVALTILLTMLIVQDDPPQGGQPLWKTRPVSGGRLLLAKGSTLFLLLGLPVVVLASPLWLVAGARLPDLAWAAFGQLAIQAVVILPVAAMAALTRTPGRFLAWSIVAFLAAPMALAAVLSGSAAEAGIWSRGVPPAYLAILLLLALVPAVFASYLERRRSRIVAAVGLGMLLGLAAIRLATREAPWEQLMARLASGGERRSETAAGIRLEVGSIEARRHTARNNEYGIVNLRIAGVPPDLCLSLRAEHQQLSWTDGRHTLTSGSLPWTSGSRDRVLLEQALFGRPSRANGEDEEVGRSIFLLGPQAALARLRQEPASYRIDARVALLRPDVGLTRPLTDSGWQTRRGQGVRVLRVEDRRNGTSGVHMLATEFLHTDTGGWSVLIPGFRDPAESMVRALLLDRRKGEIRWVVGREESTLMMAGLRLSATTLIASLSDQEVNSGRFEVVWIRWDPVSVVRRSAAAEDVRLPAAP